MLEGLRQHIHFHPDAVVLITEIDHSFTHFKLKHDKTGPRMLVRISKQLLYNPVNGRNLLFLQFNLDAFAAEQNLKIDPHARMLY
ncbi:hypothetical protein D3C78_1557290 [compost metagenome]